MQKDIQLSPNLTTQLNVMGCTIELPQRERYPVKQDFGNQKFNDIPFRRKGAGNSSQIRKEERKEGRKEGGKKGRKEGGKEGRKIRGKKILKSTGN